MHRDLRWAIVACTLDKAYFLLDLETMSLGRPDTRNPYEHLESLLQDTNYTKASDICLLGRMLCRPGAMQLLLSTSGMSFKQLICQPVGQASTVVQLLGHPWIACQGPDCRVAGAQPNEWYVT